MITSPISLLAIPLLFSPLVSAVTYECSHIQVDGIKFDFSELTGPHAISVVDENRPPSIYNTTWTVDICNKLKRNPDIDKEHQCQDGTYVCGIVRSFDAVADPNKTDEKVAEVISIAGSFQLTDGKGLDPYFTRLKAQANSDSEGLEIKLNGGTYDKRKQQAILRMVCDSDKTGNEGISTVQRRAEGDADNNATNSSISYVSYGPEEGNADMDILRLDWRTKYACEDAAQNDTSQKGGWGFFTWLILLLFLGIAAYLIFGSWLNYNRYGARGWDLLPHGDTIRDVPYLFKDWARKVIETVSGRGSRGGYSAV